MKKINLILIFSVAIGCLFAQSPIAPTIAPPPTGPITSIKFQEPIYKFGEIKQGEKVEHVFKFTNTGDAPLIISNARGSCGCTVPEWPREAIAPGASSSVKVVFDSTRKKGYRSQKVTITSNTDPAQSVITLRGEVLVDENTDDHKGHDHSKHGHDHKH